MKKVLTKIQLPEFPIEYEGLVFPKPCGTVAGVVSTLPETVLRLARTGAFGFITTKSTGPKRPGNQEPIIGVPSPGSLQNAVGLSNAGVDEYSEEMKPVFAELAQLEFPPVIDISIFEDYTTVERWVYTAKKMVDAATSSGFKRIIIEPNFSCPHSKGYGTDVKASCAAGVIDDFEIRTKIVEEVKNAVKVPVFPKFGPWDTQVVKDLTVGLDNCGASGFVASNTDLIYWPDPYDGYPIITNGMGGSSGNMLLGKSILTCKTIAENTKKPLIAMGGIHSIWEVAQYKRVCGDKIIGYGIGTGTAGMNTPVLTEFFNRMDFDYKNKTDTASKLLDTRKLMDYEPFVITKTESHGEKTKTFCLEPLRKGLILGANVGQFYFVGTYRNTQEKGWVFEEKPFSVAGTDPLKFVIKDRGLLTHELLKLKEEDRVKIKGIKNKKRFEAYGNGLPEPVSYLIAGGTGVAPINFAAEWIHPKSTIFYGAETEKELVLLDELKKNSKELVIATMDGSYKDGYTGTVVDVLKQYKIPKYANVFVCGPELMMKEAIEVLHKKGLNLDNIYCSIERQCECGIGICGKCGFDGDRICVDGPIYTARQLIEEHQSFGNWKRNKQGSKETFK